MKGAPIIGSEPFGAAPVSREGVASTGLNVLLAVITSLFFLFAVALLIRAQLSDWVSLSAPWQLLANTTPLWINTLLLASASLCLTMAHKYVGLDQRYRALQYLLAGGLFAFAFIGAQLLLWRSLSEMGYSVQENPANAFFYLLTGLHGLHLLAGLVVWAVAMKRLMEPDDSGLLIKLCGRFWHYLLLLWLFIFLLVTTEKSVYDAIGAFCGIR